MSKEVEVMPPVDRSKWGSGPWDNEPEDKIQWRDAATGLPCLMVRGPWGSWCGYVGVYPGHPWYEVGYASAPEGHCPGCYEHSLSARIQVHGGLTYSDRCAGHICHVPEPGEQPVWWFGFDTSHSGDESPGSGRARFSHETYKPESYVREEVLRLASQLADLGKKE